MALEYGALDPVQVVAGACVDDGEIGIAAALAETYNSDLSSVDHQRSSTVPLC